METLVKEKNTDVIHHEHVEKKSNEYWEEEGRKEYGIRKYKS